MLGLDPDLLPGRDDIDPEVDIGQFHRPIRQDRMKAVGIAGFGQQAFRLFEVGFMVFPKAGQRLQLFWTQGPRRA